MFSAGRLAVGAICSGLLLTGCVETDGTSTATTAGAVIDQRLVSDQGDIFLIRSDGTVGGSLRGEPTVGTFTTDGREICSTYTSPPSLTGREFCSVPEIDGNRVIFNRRDGSQSQPYTIEG
ncbi:hypothetical protein [Jannaschia seohaensis]|uniref:Uncharacterized protein n=1 Tax=Jannaschia seohaensis TaxID=475081 RepID=A0A2Y9A822_9RHOB|nr:hypothetical protein [Jannaschia seohaensis]PWJ22421.1 hypothetical protein BCF38_101834 [Jannaschia seohaensis]SSA38699.1 hypothetical protein SAMN05421539_101834 [Jannaschia seohaensis]